MPERRDKCKGECPMCPVHILGLIDGMSRGYREHVERAVIHWLQSMAHAPACGPGAKGDLVRWQIIEGHRLPTVREDLVEAASERKIVTPGGELVSFLADRLEPRTREVLAYSLSVLQ